MVEDYWLVLSLTYSPHGFFALHTGFSNAFLMSENNWIKVVNLSGSGFELLMHLSNLMSSMAIKVKSNHRV